MKKTVFTNNRAIAALILISLLAVILPVSAIQMTIDLDKSYEFKHANVSHIQAIDIGNLSQSRVKVMTTVGNNSDLQTIHTPVVRLVTRTFTSLEGSFNGINVTITGTNPSTVDFAGKPEFRIYTTPKVPTLFMAIPGQTGNPVLTKYNESWTKEDTGSLSSLFRTSDAGYLFKPSGVLHINVSNNEYTAYGFSSGQYDKNNISYTLDKNKIALTSFTGNAPAAEQMGIFFPETKAGTGKYFAAAIYHDQATETLNVYAMYPVVVLNGPTPIRWTNTTGPFTAAPFTYFSGSTDDITLDFAGTNPDLGSITKVTYLFINDSARYDMDINIDTAQLAENAETRWQTSFTPGTQIIDLLYDGIQNDVGSPFNYTMTAVGFPDPAPSTAWSVVAITPGFGISGTANSNSVTVPAAAMAQLNRGVYDLYVMGSDADNNVVALDQKQVRIVKPKPYGNWVGVFRPSDTQFILNNGTQRTLVTWGLGSDTPVSGDWNGDHLADVGVYRPSTHLFILKNGTQKTVVSWGLGSDKPVSGDWNGDGLWDVGVYRPSTSQFFLKNGTQSTTIPWGMSTDIPVAWDWNGDGMADVGVYRPSANLTGGNNFILKNGTERTVIRWGMGTDIPVAGDWNNDGFGDVGVYRPAIQMFILKNGTEKSKMLWGHPTDLPVTGKWS